MTKQIVLLFTFFSLLAAPVCAQDAREHFQRGQACYETGDYDCAAREWGTAYQMDPRPALQYNLAQAYERLGRLEEAVSAYTIYINNTEADDPRIQNARARLASLQQRVSQTSIRLTGGQEGATIFVDGQDRGRLPHPDPLQVPAGSHRIVIRLNGYQDFVSTVAVSGGQSLDVPIEMVRGQSGTASLGAGAPSLVGIIVTAIGGAALIGGAITGGLALSTANSVSSTSTAANDARLLANVTDALLFGGAAIAVTGIVLMFVIQDSVGGSSESAQLVPTFGPDYAGLSLSGSF